MSRWILIALAVVAGLLVPAPADAAVQPIPLTCGQAINAPGSYRATTSVTNCGNGVIVDLTVDNITLDLADHVVDGDDNVCVRAISIVAIAENITIRNGTVRDCDNGIQALTGATDVTVQDVVATSNADFGIRLDSNSRATGNTATNNGFTGILADDNNTINRNHATGNAFAGIDVDDGNTITGNTVSGNGDVGLIIDDNSTAKRNTLVGNDGIGIDGGNSNEIVENVVRGSEGDGISAGDTNKLIDNVSSANGANGIIVLDNNAIRSNVTKGNGLNGIQAEISARIIGNRAHENLLDGIVVSASNDNVIKRNVANRNGDKGIDGGTGAAGAGTNHAKGNLGAPPECDPEELCD